MDIVLEKIKKKKSLIMLNIFTSILGNSALLSAPFFVGKAVDNIIGVDNVLFDRVILNLTIILGLFIVSAVFLWLTLYLSEKIAILTSKEIRSDVFNHFNNLPLGYLDSTSRGNLMTILSNDVNQIRDAISVVLNQVVSGVLTIVIALAMMFVLNWLVALVVIGMTPFIFLASKRISKLSSTHYENLQNKTGEINGVIEEMITEASLVLSYNFQEESIRAFEELNEKLNHAGQKAQLYASFVNPTTRLVNNITYLLVGILGAYAAFNMNLSSGGILSLFTYSALFAKPFNEFSSMMTEIVAARASMNRVKSLLFEPLERETSVFLETDIPMSGSVVFDDVTFSYVKNKPIIENLSFIVKPMDKVAIVGPTGAGKSTLINLIMRFYEVDHGVISVDELDISRINRHSLRKGLGLVLQDTWLFEGTIKNNIKYGKKDATDEEVIIAAKNANCHDFIMGLNDGYETLIETDSTNISGGQRQLITIARALLIKPTILILDEATSSIDSLTEKRVQETFVKIMKEHTSFFIAHRLKTVIDSDLILVMNKGKIVEKGTHQELMDQEGFYHKLYMSQYQFQKKENDILV